MILGHIAPTGFPLDFHILASMIVKHLHSIWYKKIFKSLEFDDGGRDGVDRRVNSQLCQTR